MSDRLIIPESSKININQNESFTEISWEKYPKFGRYFLAMTLAIPFVITIVSAPRIIEKITHSMNHWSLNLLFLVLILIDVKILMLIWKFIRPTVPERIWFNGKKIKFYSGEHPFDRKKIDTYTFDLSDYPELQLQTVGSEQRLCFYDADEPVLIGQGLNNLERSWIYDVVRNWKIG